MTRKDCTTVYHNILTRHTTLATILILATLNTYTIVTCIKARIDDQGVLARLQIQCITILGKRRITHQYLVYDNILAHQWM